MAELGDGDEAGVVLVNLCLTWKAKPRDRDEVNVLFKLHLTRKEELYDDDEAGVVLIDLHLT